MITSQPAPAKSDLFDLTIPALPGGESPSRSQSSNKVDLVRGQMLRAGNLHER